MRKRKRSPRSPAGGKSHSRSPAPKAPSAPLRTKTVAYDPRALEQFARGDITLAQLEGIDARALLRIAEIGYDLLQQGQIERAHEVFAGLAALEPRQPYFQLALGAVAQAGGRLLEAERHYSRALVLDPDSTRARVNRGEVRLGLRSWDLAREDLLAAVSADPHGVGRETQRAAALLDQVLARNREESAPDRRRDDRRPAHHEAEHRPAPRRK